MKNSLSIGKIAGIQIFIHWSFPLIILWIIFSNVRSGLNTEQIIWSVLFVLTLFVCVTLHELGHALAAKRFHIKTKDITLLPIGGVARLENMPEKPMQELIVALAGPAVNVIIFLILYIALQIASIPFDFTAITHITADNFLFNLAILNIWLAVFNMIPAFPMDGGRVLRALLAMKLNRSLATQIAGRIGQVIAMGFVLLGFFGNPFMIFIGIFIFLAAMTETEMVKTQSVLKGHTIGELTMKQLPILNRTDTIEKAVQLLLDGQAKNFLVMDGESPYGTLNRDGIIKALTAHGSKITVETVTDNNIGYIEDAEPVEKALLLMQQHKYPLLIVTKKKELYGVVDMENILEYIMVINATAASVNQR